MDLVAVEKSVGWQFNIEGRMKVGVGDEMGVEVWSSYSPLNRVGNLGKCAHRVQLPDGQPIVR